MRMINADALLTEIQKKEAEPSYQHTGEDWCVGLIIAEGLVDEQPTIEPQKWIPCSERLVNKPVLCCDRYGEMIIGYVFKEKASGTGFSAENDAEYMYNCVAWQPLPDPWKGEE